ncbi:MAG: TonB-dependent receptor [Bacteroidetes bacterium]|nr:MAG: TonB-dependent receptor [Bacteroidota bacterium]
MSFSTSFKLLLSSSLFCFPLLLAAQYNLTGTVLSTDGQALVGANVYLPDMAKGASTGMDGSFQIADVPAGRHTLQISYVGYASLVRDVALPQTEKLTFRLPLSSFSTGMAIVSATRADERTPMTYTNLNRKEIETNNLGQDMPFLLRWTPSTVVTSDAGTGIGYTGIWIRGSDPTRVNVTINGIPLNDAESQGVFWVNMPDFASSVQDIQIQRGVGSSTNGAGAFGATLNLNTSYVAPTAYVSTDLTAGSFNTFKRTLRLGTGLMDNGFFADARLSRINSDGYIDRATSDLESWYLAGGWMNEQTSVRLVAFGGHEVTYQAWNGVDASLVDDPVLRRTNTAGTEKAGEPYDREVDDYQQTHYQLLFNHVFTPQWRVNLAGHYTRGMGYFEQYKAAEDLADYGLNYLLIGDSTITTTDLIRRRWLDNDFYGATYSLHYNDSQDLLRSTLGGGYHYYTNNHFGEIIWARFASDSEIRDRYYDNDATKVDFNIFWKTSYNWRDRWFPYLDLQFRRVDYEFLGIDNELNLVNQTASLNFFNPKAGITYQPNTRSRAYVSFAVAHREPNRNDFVGSTPANRPRPERLYDLELGAEQQGDKSAVKANLYYMYYLDQLVLNGQINDVGELLRTNVDESYRLGLELVAGTQLASGLSLQANATLSRNRVVEFVEFVDQYDADFNWIGQERVVRRQTDLAFSPNFLAGAELRYEILARQKQHDLSIALRGKYVGRRFLDNSSDPDNALDAYFFSDWQLQYTLRPAWGKAVRLNIQLLNWLDQLYESNGWSYRYFLDGDETLLQGLYPQAGRQLMVGLGVDF